MWDVFPDLQNPWTQELVETFENASSDILEMWATWCGRRFFDVFPLLLPAALDMRTRLPAHGAMPYYLTTSSRKAVERSLEGMKGSRGSL
jgi:hypothetical protein